MADAPYKIVATEQNFAQAVLEVSATKPVLIDFWAPWCGPCRALGPMLERLEEDGARFRLVKVNSDENPELSAQFGVRSIPYVVAFVDGKPVDSFVGVLPETQLRAFIDRVAPDAFAKDEHLARLTPLTEYRDRDYGVAFEMPLALAERVLRLEDSRDVYL